MRTELAVRMALDAQTRRKLADLLHGDAPITWELIEDYGLFDLFSRLPTREELQKLLGKAHPDAPRSAA